MGKDRGASVVPAGLAAGKVIVLDNGGASIKVGFAGTAKPLCVLANCIARPKSDKKCYFGDQMDNIKDISSINLKRPIEKGYVNNWEVQKDIWAHVFKTILKVDPQQCALLVTEPPFNLPSLQGAMDELAFGEFRFERLCVVPAASLALRQTVLEKMDARSDVAKARCGLVLDVGFSFTHASPVFDGSVLQCGVRRINLGGKALTNYLKELVSFRAWNMMDEYLIIEDVKEKLSYISLDIKKELIEARRPVSKNMLRREYVLPDGLKNVRGYVKEFCLERLQNPQKRKRPDGTSDKDEEQVVALTNERFMVPESLFNPTDIGINQAGLAETIVLAVNATPSEYHELMYSNIVCTGGCSSIPGFVDRLYQDLRPLVPDDFELCINIPADPISAAWQGGSVFATTPEFTQKSFSREDWQKNGNRAACQGHRVAWSGMGTKGKH